MNEMQATQTVDTVDRFFVVLLQVAFYWVHGNGDAATAAATHITQSHSTSDCRPYIDTVYQQQHHNNTKNALVCTAAC